MENYTLRDKTQLAKRSSRWVRKYAGSNIVTMLRGLGIEVGMNPNRPIAGQPCPKPDCPRRLAARSPLWKRPEHEILDIFHMARKAYRDAFRWLRSEKPAGHPEEAALHELWKKIEYAFKKRGYDLDCK